MLHPTNRFLVIATVVSYGLLFQFLLFPALTGVQSTRYLQQKLVHLEQLKNKRVDGLSAFHQLKIEWGTQLHLSQEDLLPFLLAHLEKEQLHLHDFQEEISSAHDESESITRFRIELQGMTYGTMRLLNALEHNFPFATIHDLKMQQKKRQKQIQLHTSFYFQQ